MNFDFVSSCSKVNLIQASGIFSDVNRFSSRFVLYLSLSMFSSSLTLFKEGISTGDGGATNVYMFVEYI